MIRRILRLLHAAAAVVVCLWFLTPFYSGVYNVGTALGLFVCAAVLPGSTRWLLERTVSSTVSAVPAVSLLSTGSVLRLP